MFAPRRAARLSTVRRLSPAKRQFTTALQNGFLDLAISLPFPSSLPPYSTTIILLTVVSRLAFTVPFSIWAKKRQWRAEELVVPALQEAKPLVEKQVLHDLRVEQARGTKDELRKLYSERVKKAMVARRNALFAEHRCRPWATMLIPPLSQLPLFVGTSMFLSRLAQPPTVFDSESFLTLTSLAHADPTAALPIALGMLTLANVESARWFVSAAAREREVREEQRLEERRAQGHIVLQPRKIVQSGLRLLSVGRILIAAMVPGSVVLYWVSSATFGLLQTWVFDYWERRRANLRMLAVSQQPAITAGSVVIKAKSTPAPGPVPQQRRK
ncbi:60Kd inner membrane protein-domain-containing protein [Gloeopeniophorella convolvens]|nr:60Kd inner membrane protein-domain-containing protein [Gloeopeniophorella convolvens]